MAKSGLVDVFGNDLVSDGPEMSDYKAGIFGAWFMTPRDLPPFTFDTIRYMLFDETIRLGMAIREGIIANAQFGYKEGDQWKTGVKADNEEVKAFVERQLAAIWTYDIDRILRAMTWGWSGGEVVNKLTQPKDSDVPLIEFDELVPAQSRDVKALHHKRKGLVGVQIERVTNKNGGALRLGLDGKGYWFSHNTREGSDYGESDLFGAYSAFADKWFDGGALDVRRLFMHSDAFRGRRIGYGPGTTYIAGKGEVPNQNIARQIVETYKSGDVMAYPLLYDADGRQKFVIDDAASTGNVDHIMQYPKDMDVSMLRGLGIPDDILTSELTGAWQGKKVPLVAFFMSLMRVANRVLRVVVRQILEPLVQWNFGPKNDFEVSIIPFDVQAMLTEKAYQSQGQPGAEGGMPGMPGMPGGDAAGGFGAEDEEEEDPFAQFMPPKEEGGGMSMSLMKRDPDSVFEAVSRGVIDTTTVVNAVRKIANEGLVRRGWIPFLDETSEPNHREREVIRFNTLMERLEKAVAKTETEPTPAQIESGNYAKGKLIWNGLKIAIENPKGSTRRAADGSWERVMECHYGYLCATEGTDGDHVDVFIGEHPESELVVVIDQCDESGEFDEHKVMLGFVNEADAVAAYKSNYPKGWKVGKRKSITLEQFKAWIEAGVFDRPFCDVPPVAWAMSWTKYQGPKGGKGWKNSETGKVVYQDSQPGEGDDGYEPAYEAIASKPKYGGGATYNWMQDAAEKNSKTVMNVPAKYFEKIDWTPAPSGQSQSYGAVVFSPDAKVLMRRSKGSYGGVGWTFAKGQPEGDATPAQTATKELGEETGHKLSILGAMPGTFKGSTGQTNYFIGLSSGVDPSLADGESDAVAWMTRDQAQKAIMESSNTVSRDRDLKVLKASYEMLNSKSDGTLDLVNWKYSADKSFEKPKEEPKEEKKNAFGIPDLDALTFKKSLGGSTGAKLMTDQLFNYVVKAGADPGHVKEESAADDIYRAIGIDVPEHRLDMSSGKPIKISKFIEGATPLGQLKPEARKAAIEKLKKNYAADALLANWDVIGLSEDNVLVKDGVPYRVDNGGALRYRAQGSPKGDKFGPKVGEIDSMRATGKAYNGLTDSEVAGQIRDLYAKREAILNAAPEPLKDVLKKRLAHMYAWSTMHGSSSMSMSSIRSPKGGISIQGQFYPGGQFIPNEALASASDFERRELGVDEMPNLESIHKKSLESDKVRVREHMKAVGKLLAAENYKTAAKIFEKARDLLNEDGWSYEEIDLVIQELKSLAETGSLPKKPEPAPPAVDEAPNVLANDGLIPEVMKMKKAAEVGEFLKSKNVTVGETFAKAKIDAAQDIATAIIEFNRLFPTMKLEDLTITFEKPSNKKSVLASNTHLHYSNKNVLKIKPSFKTQWTKLGAVMENAKKTGHLIGNNQLAMLCHELGHAWHFTLPHHKRIVLNDWVKNNWPKGGDLSKYGQSNHYEVVAEGISAITTVPKGEWTEWMRRFASAVGDALKYNEDPSLGTDHLGAAFASILA